MSKNREFEYIGTELELFENAHNWKSYWFKVIAPYVGKDVMDVGAGIGATATLFSKNSFDRYLAVEPDPKNFKELEGRMSSSLFSDSFQCIHGDLSNLNKDETFDTILYIDVLEHIEFDSKELEFASKHLKPGGHLIILSPAHQWLFSPFDEAVGHFRRYNKKSLLNSASNALNVKKIYYLDSVGIFASAVNKIFLRSKNPNIKQIKVWDNYIVPTSKVVDKLTRYSIGKTIIGVFQLKR